MNQEVISEKDRVALLKAITNTYREQPNTDDEFVLEAFGNLVYQLEQRATIVGIPRYEIEVAALHGMTLNGQRSYLAVLEDEISIQIERGELPAISIEQVEELRKKFRLS